MHYRRVASLLLAGGTVIDGTGARGRRADVRIAGDRIAEIGSLRPEPGETVLDCGGRVVSPGFIDAHSHADGGIFDDPLAETQIRQGITTSVVGQDGSNNFPLDDWFAKIERTGTALNFASFVGHGSARSYAMGKDYKRTATAGEILSMRAYIARGMQAGAMGMSSGLEYDPGLYSTTEELIALAQVAGIYGGMYISHVRDEENKMLESADEVIRIAREGRLPGQISHIKLASSNVWGKAPELLRKMSDARAKGIEVTADVYPYTYWQSTIIVLIPTRAWDDRALWTKGLSEVGGPANVLLTTYTPDLNWQGKTLAEIVALSGKDAVTVIQEIVRRTHGSTDGSVAAEPGAHEGVVVTAMQESDLRAFIRDPYVMFCTDGGLHPSHPRGAGSFPRLLGRFVREDHLLPLEQAIRKATSLPAARFGFRERGILREGMVADLVVFDPRTIIDRATTKNAAEPPAGLGDVIISGVRTLAGGQITGMRAGKALRRSSPLPRLPR